MKKNKKAILISLSLLASMATVAPLATPTMAAKTAVVATKADLTKQSIAMTITKAGTDKPSEAAMFLGKTAQVELKDGKISQITVHVDGSASPMTKGQDMTKMISALSLNGVAGKQANAAKDGSSFDFVFPASAYKEGKGNLEVSLNVMGKTMNEKADVTLDKVAENTAANKKTTKKATKKAKKAVKKTNKKHVKKAKHVKRVRRTLKHNAYVYAKNGKRANKKVLKKGHRVSTYGRAIKLHGKNFYKISKTTYVKKANF